MLLEDETHAERCLATIGYYRRSAYWLPFEDDPGLDETRSKRFRPGTSFARVHEIYVFDRRLRTLLMEAIERVEIHARASWVYHLSAEGGAHCHEKMARLARSVDSSSEVFVKHYRGKYTAPYQPPIWASAELMTFGELSTWIALTRSNTVRAKVAHDLGLPGGFDVMLGVIQVVALVRNICAHHSRLWNRRLVKWLPSIRRYSADFEMVHGGSKGGAGQTQIDNRIYNVIVVILHLLQHQCMESTFKSRLQEHLETTDDVVRSAMGFPLDWRGRPVWVSLRAGS